ncbi:MAG: hypothetical protein ACN4E6_08585 [Qipengyuania pacifica]
MKPVDLDRIIVACRANEAQPNVFLTRLIQAEFIKRRIGVMRKSTAAYGGDVDSVHGGIFHALSKWTPQRTVFVL